MNALSVTRSGQPFVPCAFKVPAGLETAIFRLRMLTVYDVVKDYDAVVTSVGQDNDIRISAVAFCSKASVVSVVEGKPK